MQFVSAVMLAAFAQVCGLQGSILFGARLIGRAEFLDPKPGIALWTIALCRRL